MQVSKEDKKSKAGFRILEMPYMFAYLVRFARTIWRSIWLFMMAELAPTSKKGEFKREASQFRSFVKAQNDAPFPAEAGRYVLYLGLACPWCHRVFLTRALKGLEDAIPVQYLQPSDYGLWKLEGPIDGLNDMRDVYLRAEPEYRGRFTAPVLIDSKTGRIVCNESSDLIHMLNSEFNDFAKNKDLDLRPKEVETELSRICDEIYTINNGVYACGFARKQKAYEDAVYALFQELDKIEARLSQNRFVMGQRLTEADIRLFPTIFRLDGVYGPLFKCNMKSIEIDYPNLRAWLRDVYQMPGVQDTCSLKLTRENYFGALFPLNPGGIIPVGPDLDFTMPSGRKEKFAEK